MTIESSTFTNEEYYKLNGTLSAERIEALLDLDINKIEETVTDAHNYIQDAIQPFSAEDFLSDVICDIENLVKSLRGDNRQELKRILENLNDVAQCTFNAVESSDDLIIKAQNLLNELVF